MADYAGSLDETYRLHVSDQDEPGAWAVWLRQQTKRPGWNVKRLTDASGIHKSTLFRWLNGSVTEPDLPSVRRIAEALDADMASALRAAGQLSDDVPVDEDDWEIRMIRQSGLRPEVVNRLVGDALLRRERERVSRREELARQIDLLRDTNG